MFKPPTSDLQKNASNADPKRYIQKNSLIIPPHVQNQILHLLTTQSLLLLTLAFGLCGGESHVTVEPPRGCSGPSEDYGVEWEVDSTCLNQFLSQVTSAPGMRCHGYGVAGKRMGFDHAAGDGAPHDTCLSWRWHFCCVIVVIEYSSETLLSVDTLNSCGTVLQIRSSASQKGVLSI